MQDELIGVMVTAGAINGISTTACNCGYTRYSGMQKRVKERGMQSEGCAAQRRYKLVVNGLSPNRSFWRCVGGVGWEMGYVTGRPLSSLLSGTADGLGVVGARKVDQEQVVMVEVCSRHPLHVLITVPLAPNKVLQAVPDPFGVDNFFHLILIGAICG